MAAVTPAEVVGMLDLLSFGKKEEDKKNAGSLSPREKQPSDVTDMTDKSSDDEDDDDDIDDLIAATAVAFGGGSRNNTEQDPAPVPLSPPTTRRRRSALKNNYSVQDIPICTKRRSYSVLPPPCMKQVELKRRESITSLGAVNLYSNNDEDVIAVQNNQEEEEEEEEDATNSGAARRRRSSVNFHQITIREYDQTLGDNPSVSYGPPISLDWNYEERETLNVEEYEGARPQRRSLRELGLSNDQRRDLLVTEYGHTLEEIRFGKIEAQKISKQRAKTRSMVGFIKYEAALESAGRKVKRAMSLGGKPGKQQQ